MPLISRLGAASSRGFGQFTQQTSAKYIEDYFSTYLYTGNGASQTINTGIGLSDTAAWSSYVLLGSGNDTSGYGVTTDSSGNFYVSGADLGANYSGTRYAAVTAKYNSSGVLQWQRVAYSSTGNNFGAGIAVDSSGNVYSLFFNSTSGNAFNLRKYNSSGSLQWQRDLGGGSGISSIATSVAVDSSSNVYVVGRSPQYSGDSDNIIVAKYNSSGTIQWQKSIRQSTAAEGASIAIDSSDNLYVAGTANDGSYSYAILIKMDTSGAITWQRSLRHSSNGALGYSAAVDSSGNAYIGGRATDNSGSYSFIAKYNSSGTLQWQRYFYDGTSSSQRVDGIYVDSSSNVHILSRLSSPSYASVAKYNSSGTLQWQRRFQSVTGANLNCLSGDSSGNLYLNLSPTNSGGTTQCVVKIKSDGTTASGSAFVTMVTGSATSASGSLTSSTSTATNSAGSLTTATGAITDYAGGLTNTLYTQAAVTGGGGLVWVKSRSGTNSHALNDTVRGALKLLSTDTTSAEFNSSPYGLTSFSASGFSVSDNSSGSYSVNGSSAIYASWTFRESPKFFDVVTYTGNGVAGRTISHNLGSVPGMIIVKKTNTTANWQVYHRGLSNTEYIVLNSTSIAATGVGRWNSTTPTATVFTVGSDTTVNANGDTYVAYLFAHNAGGFGADGSQNVISCGSFTTPGSGLGTITLGWEPQILLLKRASGGPENWLLFDNIRGLSMVLDAEIYPNSSLTESTGSDYIRPTPTGFLANTNNLAPSSQYIYMAIRRSPMKTPTDATTVFMPTIYTGTNVNNRLVNTTIAPDMVFVRQRNDSVLSGMVVGDRVRGQDYLLTGSVDTETASSIAFDAAILSGTEYGLAFASMNGFWCGTDATAKLNVNTTSNNHIAEAFKRAPGFFDISCYTGTGIAPITINHNLGVVPELIIVKSRSITSLLGWIVGVGGTNNFYSNLRLNDTAGFGGSTVFGNATSSSFQITYAPFQDTNQSGQFYVAYLFASCPGVSKVGSYTGTGTTQQINCGFTGGARFVLIKRTDSTGNWWVWDTARGMVSGTDPRLAPNSTAAETNANWVYTTTGGFQIVTSDATVNASGGSYIFLAIA